MYEVALLRKTYQAAVVNKFRPIAILSTFMKLFSMVLADKVRLSSISVSQALFAFVPHFQAHEVVWILRALIKTLPSR